MLCTICSKHGHLCSDPSILSEVPHNCNLSGGERNGWILELVCHLVELNLEAQGRQPGTKI